MYQGTAVTFFKKNLVFIYIHTRQGRKRALFRRSYVDAVCCGRFIRSSVTSLEGVKCSTILELVCGLPCWVFPADPLDVELVPAAALAGDLLDLVLLTGHALHDDVLLFFLQCLLSVGILICKPLSAKSPN